MPVEDAPSWNRAQQDLAGAGVLEDIGGGLRDADRHFARAHGVETEQLREVAGGAAHHRHVGGVADRVALLAPLGA